MNCIIFIGAMWIIFFKRNTPANRWILGATSIVLFVFSTAHIAASLRQLLEAFIYIPPDAIPLYSTLFWVNERAALSVFKTAIYDTTVWLQDLILIWRLYIVWDRNWKICIPPFVVDLAHMGAAYAATGLIAQPNANIYGDPLKRLGPVGWSLELVVNVSVTAAIAFRLWYMGLKVSTMSSSGGRSYQNAYLAPIFTIVESGALFAAATVVLLALYVSGNPVTLTGIDIATQLAVLTPLLIIVRVGLGLTHGLPSRYKDIETTRSQSTFHATNGFEASRSEGTTAIQISAVRDVVTASDTYAGTEDYALEELKTASVSETDGAVKTRYRLTEDV